MLRYVTSFNLDGYELYGKKMLDGFLEFWPEGDIWVYAENFGEVLVPEERHVDPRIRWIDLWKVPQVAYFVDWLSERPIFKGETPDGKKNYKLNIYKFCRKSFAQMDAAEDFDGTLVWIDGDVETVDDVPMSWLEGFIADKAMCYMGRSKWHLCASFLMWDMSRQEAKDFFSAYKDAYLKGYVFALPEWHDSFIVEVLMNSLDIPRNNISADIDLPGPFNVFDLVFRGRARHLKGALKHMEGPLRYRQLIDIAADLQPKVIIEVGTWNGQRAVELHQVCPQAEYYGFDLFELADEETDRVEMNVKSHYRGADVAQELARMGVKFTLYGGFSSDTLPKFREDFPEVRADLIFIDGGHSVETIANDVNQTLEVLAPGGVMVLDDYYTGSIDTERWGCNKVVEQLGAQLLPLSDPVQGGGFVQMAVWRKPHDK